MDCKLILNRTNPAEIFPPMLTNKLLIQNMLHEPIYSLPLAHQNEEDQGHQDGDNFQIPRRQSARSHVQEGNDALCNHGQQTIQSSPSKLPLTVAIATREYCKAESNVPDWSGPWAIVDAVRRRFIRSASWGHIGVHRGSVGATLLWVLNGIQLPEDRAYQKMHYMIGRHDARKFQIHNES